MDILLLAKCDHFLHTESSVASLASYFNPHMTSYFLQDEKPAKVCCSLTVNHCSKMKDGGAVALWLVRWTPDRTVRVQALAEEVKIERIRLPKIRTFFKARIYMI